MKCGGVVPDRPATPTVPQQEWMPGSISYAMTWPLSSWLAKLAEGWTFSGFVAEPIQARSHQQWSVVLVRDDNPLDARST